MQLARRLRQAASNVVQYEPLRKQVRLGGAIMLEARGFATQRFGSHRALRNIYGLGVQKAGSQWAKAVFDHELVVSASGLATFPSLAYADRPFRNRFPAHCFVPDLYLSYPEYSAVHKEPPYRTYYVARDPRDIVVSWYFSVRDTHRLIGPIGQLRQQLASMSVTDGLLLGMRYLAPQFDGMRTWLDVSEPEVAFFRLEDMRDRPDAELRRLLSHCEVGLSEEAFARVLLDTSREALRKKDLEHRSPGEGSHYRQNPSDHARHFEKVHHEAFREITGDLVERLGYR